MCAYAPMRGLERHIYSCVYAFWPYLEELSLLQPEVGSESFGISSQLFGAIKTWLCTHPHSVSSFFFFGVVAAPKEPRYSIATLHLHSFGHKTCI